MAEDLISPLSLPAGHVHCASTPSTHCPHNEEVFAAITDGSTCDPGMHRSATIDMLYVVSGRCVLELDDGSKTELDASDVIVQSGTMHRWHNPWDEPCRIVSALVGAHLK